MPSEGGRNFWQGQIADAAVGCGLRRGTRQGDKKTGTNSPGYLLYSTVFTQFMLNLLGVSEADFRRHSSYSLILPDKKPPFYDVVFAYTSSLGYERLLDRVVDIRPFLSTLMVFRGSGTWSSRNKAQPRIRGA